MKVSRSILIAAQLALAEERRVVLVEFAQKGGTTIGINPKDVVTVLQKTTTTSVIQVRTGETHEVEEAIADVLGKLNR